MHGSNNDIADHLLLITEERDYIVVLFVKIVATFFEEFAIVRLDR